MKLEQLSLLNRLEI